MEKLVVLEYSTNTVHIYNVHPDTTIDEEYLQNMGFHTSECSWMTSEELNIYHHKGALQPDWEGKNEKWHS